MLLCVYFLIFVYFQKFSVNRYNNGVLFNITTAKVLEEGNYNFHLLWPCRTLQILPS